MDKRLDSAFESAGGFSLTAKDSPVIEGRLLYDPEKGITFELIKNPQGTPSFGQGGLPPIETMFGQLMDGTRVTLSGCFISNASFGAGVGSPTTIKANRALFGRHVEDVNQLRVKKYSLELSSLANWTCTKPVNCKGVDTEGKEKGVDVICRIPPSIVVSLPNQQFDVQIAHAMNTQHSDSTFTIKWVAAITVVAHDSLALQEVNKIAYQFQNLMSLLIGERPSSPLKKSKSSLT